MRIVAITLMVILGVRAPTCGERGGPGYRGPDGQCVSGANIARIAAVPRRRIAPPNRCHPRSRAGHRRGPIRNNQPANRHRAGIRASLEQHAGKPVEGVGEPAS